jgi:ankyrin repeat protein
LQEATPAELAEIKRQALHIRRNAQGCMALHYAVAAHKWKLVKQLLELGAGADVPIITSIPDPHRITPLHLACLGRMTRDNQMEELLQTTEHDYDMVVSCLH